MNTSHRSIWNAALGAWVAVSEIARGRGKPGRSGGAALGALALVALALAVESSHAETVSNGTRVVNAGAPLTAGPVTVDNTLGAGATLQIDAGYSTGNEVILQNGGTLNNDGTIQRVGALGVKVAVGGATVNNTVNGVIEGENNGVALYGGGTVTNTGGQVRGTVVGSFGVYGSGAAATVINQASGTITGLSAGVMLIKGGTVTNTGTGSTISSTGNGTTAVYITGATATISNTGGGLITGSGNGVWIDADTATVTNGANSTISGGTSSLYATKGDVTFSNAGLMIRQVQLLGTGSHKVTLFTGSEIRGLLRIDNANSTLTLDGTGSQLYSAAVTRLTTFTGELIKQGSGHWTLDTAGTQARTTLNAGTLTLGHAAALGTGALTVGGAATLDNNSALVLGNDITLNAGLSVGGSNNLTLSGNMSGAGGLVKNGIANLTLSGNNSFAGLLDVQAGNAATTGTLASASGANVAGSALLSLGANASLGALTGSGTVNIGSGHTLSLGAGNQSSSFGGNLTGAGGTLSKLGSGNLILLGASSYSGATSINAGMLSVNGSMASSAVTVNSGGTLGGSGTVGSTNIADGGVLAPGNSIGTLTVNGNLNFALGSTYRVEVDAAGNNDRIHVTGAPGTATISGGNVDVQASAGTYAANTSYTILNATGGRTGTFAGVTSNLAFLTPTLAYDANNVFLNLARNNTSFSAVAVTPNQIATATALQNTNAGATGDMSTVQTTLTGLSAAQARAAYDSASGAGLVALRGAGASFAAGLGNQLQARLGAVQGGGGSGLANSFSNRPVLLAANDHVSDLMAPISDSPQKFSLAGGTSSAANPANQQGRGFWLRGSGGYQDTRSDGNAAANKLRNSGISAGFDTELRDGFVVGAAISNGISRLSFDNNNDAGKSRGSAVALYGSYAAGPWAFKGSASLAWNDNHMERAVTLGALSRTASSDFDSNTLSAYGEATYAMPMAGWTLQPLAALSVSRSKADGFTETGAGALNLQVAGQSITSTKSLLGAKASVDTGSVRLEPRVIWAHEFGDLNTPMTAQFQGAATASPFQVSGVALKRDTLILGLGASGRIQKNIDLFADLQAEHNSRQNNLAVLVGLRARW